MNGNFISYYENGKISWSGKFIDGKMEGEFNYYLKDGKLINTITYSENKEVGPFTVYHNWGGITKGVFDNYHETVILELFDETGKLIDKL